MTKAYEHSVCTVAIYYIRGMLTYGAFEPCCFIVWWTVHTVTCTYLKVLHGQTRQLKWRDSLTQSSVSLLLLVLLLLLQHHSCHFKQFGLKLAVKMRIINSLAQLLSWNWVSSELLLVRLYCSKNNTLRANLRDAEIFDFFYTKKQ